MLPYIAEHWVAIAALALSAFLLYRDYLAPFRLEVRSAGRATVARNPFSEGLKQGCVLADLIFTNLGTRRGVVEDVALSVQSNAGLVLLRTHSIVLDRTINLAQGLPPPSLEPFTGFALSKGEAIVRRIMFVPSDPAAAFAILPSKYSAGIWTRCSPSPESWSSHGAISFTVDDEDMKVLATSTVTPVKEGGFFVKWVTRDKVLDVAESHVKSLARMLGAPE